MKVSKTTANGSETSSTLDFSDDLKGLSEKKKREVLTDIGDLIIENTLVMVGDQKSPINGEGKFKPLSKDYKEFKQSEVGNKLANLELNGDLMSSVDYEIAGSKIKVGVFGSEAPKADGHNNLSGKSSLPQRRFLPDKSQEYVSSVQKEIDRIIADAKSESTITKYDLQGIEKKSELYDTLGELLGLSSRAEIKLAVFRSDNLLDLLKGEGLFDLL